MPIRRPPPLPYAALQRPRFRPPRRLLLYAGLLALVGPPAAGAYGATFDLPPDSRVVTAPERHASVAAGETLLDIARRFDLGINDLAAANPGLDRWLPPPGSRVVIPSRFVLPSAPQAGIVVNLPEMRLYYYPPPPAPRYRSARVEIYPLGIGTEGKTLPLGATTVVEKLRDPTWVVPASIIAERRADGRPVQETVPPGPNNPLGRFALRLGWTSYLIHGTNQPFGIGMRVSHGCLRMYPEDVARLFGEVTIGTPVRIVDQPYKAARHHGRIYLEAHAPLTDSAHHPPSDLTGAVAAVIAVAGGALDDAAWGRVERVALQHRGILMPITAPVAAAADSRPLVAQAVPQGNGAQGWDVQIGAYRQSAGSRRVGEKIRALHWHPRGGMPPGGALCRIYVGPFASRAQARARQRALWKITGIEGQIYPAAHYAGFQPCD